MAGDWIKLEHVTPDKPEIHRMAEKLGMDSDAVVGKLLRFWIWADQQAISGNAISVTKTLIDRITYAPGFADALLEVDWLQARSGSFAIPHFDRHNGQTAKKRAETNRRVADHRKRNTESVTNVTPEPLQKALPEKRREEKSIEEEKKDTLSRKSTPVPPPETPWPASASERGGGMDSIMKRINSLRPEWQLPAQWNASEMHALHGGAASQICELTDSDWQDLTAYMAARGLPKDYWQPRSRLKFVETFSDVCASLQRWRDKGHGNSTNKIQPLNPFR